MKIFKNLSLNKFEFVCELYINFYQSINLTDFSLKKVDKLPTNLIYIITERSRSIDNYILL